MHVSIDGTIGMVYFIPYMQYWCLNNSPIYAYFNNLTMHMRIYIYIPIECYYTIKFNGYAYMRCDTNTADSEYLH